MTRIFTFLFCLLSLGVCAQIFDINLPTGPGNAVEIIKVDNNRYVTVGHSYGKAYAYKVNRQGQPVKIKHFKNILGGSRSAFTDVIFANGAYYMAGFCEDCVAGDPGRKIVIVKTDTEFKTLKLLKLDSPSPSNIDSPFGWSKVASDGNDIFVMSQLEDLPSPSPRPGAAESAVDTTTNFALTKLDEDLNIDYHKRYDYAAYDNVGDIQVYNGTVYAMAWNPNYSLAQPLFGIGNEETALHAIDPNTGNIDNTFLYPGVGLSLTDEPNSTNLIIGGARTTSLQAGPQAAVTRIDRMTGSIVDFNTFGTNNRVDAILDIKVLPNGNFIAATMVNNPYPSLNAILNSSITSFTDLVRPREARVYRIRGNDLSTIGGGFLMPNLFTNNPIMVSCVLPLSIDGLNFITTGYRTKTAYFHSRTAAPNTRPIVATDVVSKLRNDEATGLESVTISVFPNPASASEGVFMGFEGNMTDRSRVMVYDALGRLAEQTIVEQQGRYRVLKNGQSGVYNILVIDAHNNVQNYRVVVE